MITRAKMIRTCLETIIECAPQVTPEARMALRLLDEEFTTKSYDYTFVSPHQCWHALNLYLTKEMAETLIKSLDYKVNHSKLSYTEFPIRVQIQGTMFKGQIKVGEAEIKDGTPD